MLFSKLEIPKKFKGKKLNQGSLNLEMENDWSILILDINDSLEKTKLLMQVIQLFGEQVSWYHLDFLDNKESIFLDYLKECLKKAIKGIEFENLTMEGNLAAPFCYLKYMEQIICTITEYTFENETDEYCLILDSFQEIENDIIFKMIQQLIDNLPKGFHLVITADESLPQFIKYKDEKNVLLNKKLNGKEDFTSQILFLPKNSFVETPILEKENAETYVSFYNGFHVKNIKSGKEICWRTKKEKELFAYFFSLKEKLVDRSHLLEILWNDRIPENGIAMLHNMIYHIRKEMERISHENIIQYKKKNTACQLIK